MLITDYSFGRITIEGTLYTKDVIIVANHVYSPWWRKEGHSLCIDDLQNIIQPDIQELIIGTGHNGAMRVPRKTTDYLVGKNIALSILKTGEAVKRYNERVAPGVAAALHLTC